MTQKNNRLKFFFRCFTKRVFDLIISIIGIFFLMPFFVILTIIIKISSEGNILHIQNRFGKDGKIFKLLKFKTMFKDADDKMREYLIKRPHLKEEWEEYKKLRSYDPRVTPIGKLLRRFSLDELPQLFNVVKGDMSMVGPRPYLVQEKEDIKNFSHIILQVKPGITGLWQIRGRCELSFKSRINMDIYYVKNWTLFKDIIIIIKTFGVVIRGRGAY